MSVRKRKNPHSAIKNIFYKLSRNAVFYAVILLVFASCFVAGALRKKDVGKLDASVTSGKNTTVTVSAVKPLEVYFIDVGQGDATLIKFPDGKNMLIDGGRSGAAVEKTLAEYLTDERGKPLTIDYCVATHSDEDHIGSLAYVYKNRKVACSFRPYIKSDKVSLAEGFNVGKTLADSLVPAYDEYLAAANNENTYYEFFDDESDFSNAASCNGQTYSYSVDFVLPYAPKHTDFKQFDDANDFSAVIAVTYGKTKMLFCGDIGAERERDLVKAYKDSPLFLDCTVLKVSHHGSANSTCSEFLGAVKPEYAVISCGLGNEYGHPSKSVLERLQAACSTVCRTDLQGTVGFSVSYDGEITRVKSCRANDEYLFLDGTECTPYLTKIQNEKRRSI